MAFTEEDRISIAFLRKTKKFGAKRLMRDFPEKGWTLGGLNCLLKKIDATGSCKRRVGSGRKRHARTEANIATIEQLINSKGSPDTPRSLRKISKHLGISKGTVGRIINIDLPLKNLKKPKPPKEKAPKKKRVSSAKKNSDSSISNSFNPDQRQQILSVLNKYLRDDLWQFNITKNNATAVVKHRKKHGDFTRLEDALKIERFDLTILQKFCDSVIYGSNEDEKCQPSQLMQLCNQTISEEMRQKLYSVVALHFFGQEVVWVHVNRDIDILEWNSVPLSERPRPYNYVASLQIAREIVGRLPPADVYLLEQRHLKGGAHQLSPLPVIAGTIQLESMITVLLNQESGFLLTDRVLTIKHNVVSQFFNLVLVNELASGQALVDELIGGRHFKEMRPLTMNPAVWQVYNNQSKTVKEEFARILLHALAFFELEMKRGPTGQHSAQAPISQSPITQPHNTQPHNTQPHNTQPHISQSQHSQPQISQPHIPQPQISQPQISQPHISQAQFNAPMPAHITSHIPFLTYPFPV